MAITMSRRPVEIVHVVIDTAKTSSAVQRALEASIPAIDPELTVLLAGGVTERLRQRLDAAPELVIFVKHDHGMLLGIHGQTRDAVLYEIGNPLTASTITQRGLAAALYVPMRVIVFEKDGGGSQIEYDLPSSVFAQFRDQRIAGIARRLDVAFARAFSKAAS